MHHIVHLSVLNGCRRAHGAGYQHGNRRGCLRGTRETVLSEIESWTKDFDKSPVFWLNGFAGTGKSTITQTVAERVFADGLLGASFFCSRDFEDRSDLHFIFPTIAFQLAHEYPDFQDHLIHILQSNPDIVDESLYNQMELLIVEPLKLAGVSTVIVIDALDECKDEESSSAILSVLGRFIKKIPRVKFFITGRPEPWIKSGFRLPRLVDSTNVFVLHDVHPSLISGDIWLFLKHSFLKITNRRDDLDGWPTDEDIEHLLERTEGLFVYAVAMVKFIDHKNNDPRGQLGRLLQSPKSSVHEWRTTLDSLYMSIPQAELPPSELGTEFQPTCNIDRTIITGGLFEETIGAGIGEQLDVTLAGDSSMFSPSCQRPQAHLPCGITGPTVICSGGGLTVPPQSFHHTTIMEPSIHSVGDEGDGSGWCSCVIV